MLITYFRLFTSYGGMDESVQKTIQELITPLVRALGSSHGKLLTLLRTFPTRAASLALRILQIWTEYGRPSPQLVSLVKGLMSERDLDARFLIPIIAEMDKVTYFSLFFFLPISALSFWDMRRLKNIDQCVFIYLRRA